MDIVAGTIAHVMVSGDPEVLLRLLLALALLAAVVPVLLGLAHPALGALARVGVAVGGVVLAAAVAQRLAAWGAWCAAGGGQAVVCYVVPDAARRARVADLAPDCVVLDHPAKAVRRFLG